MESTLQTNLAYLIVIGSLALFVLVAAVLLFFILYQKRVLKSIQEKRTLENKYQKELLHHSIETQEDERKRIAADLHDDIGGKLSAIKMMLKQLQLAQPANKSLLNDCQDSLQETLDSARNISHNLMPPSLETIGLIKVLERLTKSLNNPEFKLTVSYPKEVRFGAKIELALYRILQELINNTLKYSKANNATITFLIDQENWIMRYADNGIGYSHDEESMGMGLRNIKSRVEMIQGSLHFFSEKNEANGLEIIILKNDL